MRELLGELQITHHASVEKRLRELSELPRELNTRLEIVDGKAYFITTLVFTDSFDVDLRLKERTER